MLSPGFGLTAPTLAASVERERRVLDQIACGAPLHEALESLLREVEAETSAGMRASVLVLDDDGGRLLHGAAPSLPDAYNEAIHGIAIGEASLCRRLPSW